MAALATIGAGVGEARISARSRQAVHTVSAAASIAAASPTWTNGMRYISASESPLAARPETRRVASSSSIFQGSYHVPAA